MTVAEYMFLALGHPDYGYYQTRDPLGQAGDFTTAPEISQMFGEMIGAWCVATSETLPAGPINLVELGPGRGTLMADMLRVARLRPEFYKNISVHLVETSPALRAVQKVTLGQYQVHWYNYIEDIPQGPALFIMNEFFDALPVRQFYVTETGLAERCVGLDPASDRLQFCRGASIPVLQTSFPISSIVETCPAALNITQAIAQRIVAYGGAALIVDYGYSQPAVGDTLQAVKAHHYTDILSNPGDSDLTAHVDFSALAHTAIKAGATIAGPVEQGLFLRRLGIELRAETLKNAGDTQAVKALHRLVSPGEMGALFKVMSITRTGVDLAGFS